MPNPRAELKRDGADPVDPGPAVPYFRALREIAAEASAGDGGVVATVNGYGGLTRIRISPEMLSDLPRLEILVAKAVNRATDEAERQNEALPVPEMEGYVPPWISEPPAEFVGTPKPPQSWCDFIMRLDKEQSKALTDASMLIRDRIRRDMQRVPRDLWELLFQVDVRLGEPGVTAASVRRCSGIQDKYILRRFRRRVGVSLTEYIRERKMETVMRMIYRSDLPFEEIAEIFGFSGERALASAIEAWWGSTLAELRDSWDEQRAEPLIWRWVMRGGATEEQIRAWRDDFERLYPGVIAKVVDDLSGSESADR
ncbi:MAG: helix-turn-helix domain-containing protein [bacterium]|nr:helix-turn-helix domain-containing protein [bacterium]